MRKEILMICIVAGFVQSVGIVVVFIAANNFSLSENFATGWLPIRVYRTTDEPSSCGVFSIAANILILDSKLCCDGDLSSGFKH